MSNINEALAAVKKVGSLTGDEILPAINKALDELEKVAPSQVRGTHEKDGKTMVRYIHSQKSDISITAIITNGALTTFNVVADIE